MYLFYFLYLLLVKARRLCKFHLTFELKLHI